MIKKLLPFILLPGMVISQVIFESSSSSVYDFLNRLSVKGLIVFNDELRPLSRKYIAEKLLEVEKNSGSLTSIEREELIYYKQDFYPEVLIIRGSEEKQNMIFRNDENAGFRPFLYRDKNFSMFADPVLGLIYNRQYKDNHSLRYNGLTFSGYFYNAGFNFYFRDNAETGNSIDHKKRITPEPGIVPHKSDPDFLDYSFVRGTVSYSWDWGSIDFGKDYIEWGSGQRGRLILSNKAPSFPFFRLIFNPVDWLQFQYLHGWLFSGIVNPATIHETLVPGRESYSQYNKFIAAHIISFYPIENLSFSIGESVIYSDQIEPLYLIPVLFFRVADHYNSDAESNSGDNAQVFANAVYKYYPLNLKLYSTLFIDELSLTDFLKGGNLSSIGLTIGLNAVDPVLKNSEVVLEYTRTDPFLYMNSNDLQLYTSHGYQLGHWIGSNADQVYFSYKQWILTRGLMFNFWGEYVRKGQSELPEQQYQAPYPPLLYGNRLKIANAGLRIKYEFFRRIFAQISYQYSNIRDEELLRIPDFQSGSNHSFGFSLSYGM